jgi:hypothetical protein
MAGGVRGVCWRAGREPLPCVNGAKDQQQHFYDAFVTGTEDNAFSYCCSTPRA